MGAKGGYLDARLFVENNMGALAENGMATALLPAIFLLLAAAISFATGTSWGTFGILIPVAVSILGTSVEPAVILTISAILAGSVYGDHVSPISDTTIMASSGAQCNHIDHVKTQLPYATVVMLVSFVAYIISGIIVSKGLSYGVAATVTLASGLLMLAIFVAILYILYRVKEKKNL
jgi:Na+/H+ antiporter NhaC